MHLSRKKLTHCRNWQGKLVKKMEKLRAHSGLVLVMTHSLYYKGAPGDPGFVFCLPLCNCNAGYSENLSKKTCRSNTWVYEHCQWHLSKKNCTRVTGFIWFFNTKCRLGGKWKRYERHAFKGNWKKKTTTVAAKKQNKRSAISCAELFLFLTLRHASLCPQPIGRL